MFVYTCTSTYGCIVTRDVVAIKGSRPYSSVGGGRVGIQGVPRPPLPRALLIQIYAI